MVLKMGSRNHKLPYYDDIVMKTTIYPHKKIEDKTEKYKLT